MKHSPDPLLEEVQQYVKNIQFGRSDSVGTNLQQILSNKKIFGVDLYEVGLGEKIEMFFKQLINGKGAVRATLHQLLGE
jgi:fructuronate reductase